MSLKNRILYAVITLSISLNTGCGGETVVTKIVPTEYPGTQPNHGVIFSLPQTVVSAEVPLTRVASDPGIFASWTPFFYPELTPDDFITEQKSVFKVGLAKFDTRGQTDPDNVYIAHFKAKQFETKTLLLEFNEDGIIARTDASSKDDTIDVVTSGIKIGASIVAPLIGGIGAVPSTVGTNLNDLDVRLLSNRVQLMRDQLDQSETTLEKSDCEQKLIAAREARERASRAAEKARGSRKETDKTAAEEAQKAADDVSARAEAFCSEERFKSQLSPEARALYDSLDDNYKAFLRENFGYQFLTYLAKRPLSDGSTGIQFFLTLSKNQQEFIDKLDRSASPCEKWPVTSKKCLATGVKLDLLRAKAAYDKILELRKKRQDTLFETTGTDVNTSSHLEFRLKELDSQIKSLEQTFFFGTSTETSGVAKFEFTPGKGLDEESQPLFTYSKGGAKPGVCSIEDDDPGVFKAFVPEPLKGVCHASDFLISSDDVRDTNAFVNRFKTGARDNVSSYLFNQFRAQTQRLIDSSKDDDKPQVRSNLLNELLTDLKNVIEGPSIYQTVVQDIKLSDATLKLQTEIVKLEAIRNPTPEQLAQLAELRRRLNRSLLDDTYAKELYRRSAWAPHSVALVIDPRTPGVASAVAKQKLVENGKRGFPYRIAALTTARMLDDETEKGRSAVRIAQFGPVQSLPANLGGRRSSYKITYFDSTGQIKVFDMSADALIQKDNVKDVTDAVTTLRDSEAAKLERDTKLLELRKKRIDAEKALKAAAKEEPSPTPEP
jgi:hypothetical protein